MDEVMNKENHTNKCCPLVTFLYCVSCSLYCFQIEAQVVMAKLVKNLTFDLVPGQSFNYVRSITCKPKDSCRVYVKRAVPKSDIMKEVELI